MWVFNYIPYQNLGNKCTFTKKGQNSRFEKRAKEKKGSFSQYLKGLFATSSGNLFKNGLAYLFLSLLLDAFSSFLPPLPPLLHFHCRNLCWACAGSIDREEIVRRGRGEAKETETETGRDWDRDRDRDRDKDRDKDRDRDRDKDRDIGQRQKIATDR
jgi:hypothetical protein